MDAALERQLNLAFEVSVLVTFNNDTKKIIVINQGKTAVLVWGAKSEQSPPVKFAQPRFVVPGAAYEFFLEEAFNRLSQTVPKGTQQDLPEDLYIKSADGKPYVVHDVLRALWEGDNFKIYSTTTAITQEEWPKEIQ
jgi:DNA-binding beta-propeller fold protein YncE